MRKSIGVFLSLRGADGLRERAADDGLCDEMIQQSIYR
jgi:hypothetical protein